MSGRRETDQPAAAVLTEAARKLFANGRADLARTLAKLALKADPENGDAHAVMAGVLDSEGAFARAVRHWREAARLAPSSPRRRLNLAIALLGGGDWNNGLPLYESRLESEDWSTMAARPSLATMRERRAGPETDLTGRHVLVVTEQGLGDSIWAARFLAPLAERCERVTLATSAVLRPLLEGVTGPDRVIAPPAGQKGARINLSAPEADCDYVVPMLSLPWLLGSRPDDAALPPVPYLTPEPAAVEAWRARYRQALPRARRIVGLVWRVNPNGPAAVARSIPVAMLAQLAEVGDTGFVILQGDARSIRKEIEPVLPGVLDGIAGTAEPTPLIDYAAAIAATDVLVSVDTMSAHVAGAMGHPGLIMLATAPSLGALFWGHTGDRSAWYPSLRLIRQRRYWDWSDAIAALVETLKPAGGR